MVMDENKTGSYRSREKKSHDLHIRGTKTQLDFLDILSYESDKTKTDLVWEALDFWYKNKKGSF